MSSETVNTSATLTKAEAISAMKRGERVAHRYFSSEEWIEYSGLSYRFEDGILCDPRIFWSYRSVKEWDTDWRIVRSN